VVSISGRMQQGGGLHCFIIDAGRSLPPSLCWSWRVQLVMLNVVGCCCCVRWWGRSSGGFVIPWSAVPVPVGCHRPAGNDERHEQHTIRPHDGRTVGSRNPRNRTYQPSDRSIETPQIDAESLGLWPTGLKSTDPTAQPDQSRCNASAVSGRRDGRTDDEEAGRCEAGGAAMDVRPWK